MTVTPVAHTHPRQTTVTFNPDVWYGRKPLTDVGRAMVADVALLEVGWSVWSCDRKDANEEALGGVVSQIRTATTPDVETGEIAETRYFRCLNPYLPPDHRHFVQTLIGSEILLPDGVEPPNRKRIGRLMKRLCAEASSGPWWTGTDLDNLTDAWRLAKVME